MNIFGRLFKGDETSAAIAQAKKNVRENPQDANAWVALGDTLADAKQYKEAGTCYAKALQIEPRPNIALRVGQMLVMMGEYNKAIEGLEKVSEGFPTMSSIWATLATAYMDAQRWQDAIQAATRASQLAPDLNVSPILGLSYLNLKDYTNQWC